MERHGLIKKGKANIGSAGGIGRAIQFNSGGGFDEIIRSDLSIQFL